MSDLKERFDKAAEDVKNLKRNPDDNDLLELYSFYKQALIGDCNIEKPGILDFKGKSKWEAWNSRKGVSNEDAMQSYVEKAQSLVESHGLK